MNSEDGNSLPLSWEHNNVMNWGMTERSACFVFNAQNSVDIRHALTAARERGLSVIPHGAGHSYTDAANHG